MYIYSIYNKIGFDSNSVVLRATSHAALYIFLELTFVAVFQNANHTLRPYGDNAVR